MGSFGAGEWAVVRVFFALNSEDPRAVGSFGDSTALGPESRRWVRSGKSSRKPWSHSTRPRPPGRCDSVRSGNSRRDILPAQIAIGFVLENRVIASGGRRACPKADTMSSACGLSKSIAGETTSLYSRVAPCLVHNASRRGDDCLSPCHPSSAAPLWIISGKTWDSAFENHREG